MESNFVAQWTARGPILPYRALALGLSPIALIRFWVRKKTIGAGVEALWLTLERCNPSPPRIPCELEIHYILVTSRLFFFFFAKTIISVCFFGGLDGSFGWTKNPLGLLSTLTMSELHKVLPKKSVNIEIMVTLVSC